MASIANAQTFTGTGGSITDNSVAGTCFNINVTGVGAINGSYGLATVCVKLSHTYDGDLSLYLTAPDGTVVALTTNNGGSGDNYFTTCFGDYATNPITGGSAPFNGFYQPEGVLGNVNNGQNANGQWKLCIYDNASGNTGTLTSWTIAFSDYPEGPPACNTNPAAADLCANATPICDLQGYCGNTSTNTYAADYWSQLGSGNTGTGAACFGIQNNSWLKFTAASSTISFDCWVTNSTNGQGLQIMVLQGTCGGSVNSVFCDNTIAPNNAAPTPITITGLTPGQQYFIMLDGNSGDVVDYIINANSGFSVPQVTPSTAAICQGGSVTLTASGGNGTYSWSPSTGLSATTGTTVVATPPVGTITYNVSSTTLLGCPYSASSTVTVTAPSNATINYTTPICKSTAGNVNVTQTGTAGGTYSASPAGLTINSTTGAITPGTSNAGTYTVTYSIPATGGCPAFSTTKVVTITAPPTATIAYTGSPYCTNGGTASVTQTGNTGGTYTASPGGLSLNSSTGAITLSTSFAGTYTVTYTLPASGGCPVYTATASVTVTTLPAASISYAGSPFCTSLTNGAVTRIGTAGGTYTASPAGLSINASTGAVNPSTSTPGTYTVSYTLAAASGCPQVIATATVVISQAPSATISYAGSPFCTSGSAVNVTRTGTAGGTYSASPTGLTINSATGVITPSSSNAGTYTVTYTIAAANGCPVFTTTASVVITAAPNATISYPGSPYCSSAGNALVTRTGTAGGTYSALPTGLTINSTTGTITPGSSTPGTYTVTYTIAASGGCPAFSTTASVTITQAPTATIAYAGPFCTSTATAAVTLTGLGLGSFSASPAGLTINATTGLITPSSSLAGTYTVTYTLPALNGCPAFTTTASVTITAPPSATIAYAGSPYCTSSGVASVTRTGTAGGTYTSSPGGLTINSSTGSITPSSSTAGTYTVTYTVAATGGCPAFTTTTSVVISAPPTAAISYAGSPFCTSTASGAVTQTGTTGGAYSATPGGLTINSSTGTITPGSSTPGTYTVTYTVPAANGCPAFTTTANVVINTAPTATIAYSGSPYCSNAGTATVTLTGTTGGGFTASPGGLSVNVSTGAVNTATSTPGTYTVTYTVAASGGCPAFTTTAAITIIASPTATISYSGPYCSSAASATVTQSGTSGGIFTATPAGLSLDAGTGAVNPSASTPGSYVVTYTVSSGSCTASDTANLVINTAPGATISYANNPYCKTGGTATVTQTGTTGGTYTATPAGLTINASTGTVTLGTSTAGTYTVIYTVAAANGCPAFTTTASITVNAPPVAAISYPGGPFCSTGAAVNVTQTGASGGSYSVSPAGLIINTTTGQITPTGSTAGTYTVTYTLPAANGCGPTPYTTTVVINNPPGATISYASPLCKNAPGTSAVVLTGTTGGAFSASPGGLSLNATTGAITPGTSTVGIYTVTYTVPAGNGCPAFSTTASVEISSAPTATIAYAGTPYCSNEGNATVTQTGSAGGVYTASPAGLSLNTTTGDINLSASAAGTYTVTYTIAPANGCIAFSTTTSIVVTTAPAATIAYAGSPYCTTAGTKNVTLTGTTGGTYSALPAGLTLNSTTGTIIPGSSAAGTYTVTYAIAANGGCPAFSTTATVTITQAPTATIAYAGSPYCSTNPGTVSPTQTGTTGGTYTAAPAGLSINNGTGAIYIAGSAPGSYTVTYSIAAGGGCAAFNTTASITITQSPSATIAYNGVFCQSAPGNISVVQTGTTGGTYTSLPSGLTINSATGAVTPGSSTPGNYTVTYTLAATGGCPAFTTSTQVSVATAPTAAISYGGSPYCSSGGTANVTLTGNAGGVYSATPAGLSINSNTGAVDLGASTAGSYTVSYNIPAANGCVAVNASAAITITQAPSATINYPADPYCTGGGSAVATLTGTTGGTYSALPAGLILNPTTSLITLAGSTPGTYVVSYTVAAGNGCPAFVTTDTVVVNLTPAAPTVTTPVDYCQGDTATALQPNGTGYLWYNSASGGTGVATFTPNTASPTTINRWVSFTQNGCESARSLVTVHVYPTYNQNISANICQGQSYNFGGTALSASGAYTHLFNTIHGCDSVVNLTLTVNPVYNLDTAISICQGQSYAFGGTSYSASGTYNHTFQTTAGCDSAVTLHLTVISTLTTTINADICQGQSYAFNGSNYTTTGTHVANYPASTGCDSVVTLHLTVHPVYNQTLNAAICQGESYAFAGSSYNTSGIYPHTFASAYNCDSTVTLVLVVNPVLYHTDSMAICFGQSYTWGGTTYTTAGVYVDTFAAATTCDSIVTLTLTVNPTMQTDLYDTICNGQSYTFAGNTYTTAGTYSALFNTSFGCDSTVLLHLFVKPKPAPPVVTTPVTYCQYDNMAVPLVAVGQNVRWYETIGGSGTTLAPTPPTDVAATLTWYATQTVDGCASDADSIIVTIIPKPEPPLVRDTILCQGGTPGTLTAVGDNLLWYTTPTGGVGLATAPTMFTALVTSNTWYVSQTVNGCESNRAAITASVIARPIASFNIQSSPACQQDTVTLTFTGTGDATMTYNWQYAPASLISGTGAGPLEISYPDDGTFDISLTVIDRGCASVTAISNLTVKPIPVAIFTLPDEGCIDRQIEVALDNTDRADVTYTWTWSGGRIVFGENGGPYGVVWSDTGYQQVTMTASFNGCDAPTQVDSILIHPNPVANILNSPTEICAKDTVLLTAQTEPGWTYHWSPVQEVTDSTFAGEGAIRVPRTGYVYLTVVNQWGCDASDSLLISTRPCCNVSFPTAFTPNADGRNDIFRMIGDGNQQIQSFRIVNRWGQVVFETKDQHKGWDGSYNGVQQEMGTYYYFLSYICSNGEVIDTKGDVTLVR